MGLRGKGAKPVGKLAAKKGAKRRVKPWEKPGLSRAERVVAFVECLKITSGFHAGRKFKLRPWQKEIIRDLYRTDAKGRRVVRKALITLPRKNGKTVLTAAIALAHLCGPEAIPRGQIYSAAAGQDQADLIREEMVAFVMGDEELRDRIIIRNHVRTLTDNITGSRFKALPADGKRAHGLGASVVVADELAQWPGKRGRELYEALTTGMGGRAEPLAITISTKSGDPTSLMSEQVAYAEKVLAGTVKDDSYHATIYAAAHDADPWSEATWRAYNPALGDFLSLDHIRDEAAQAQQMPSMEPGFRLLYLNQPTQNFTAFLKAKDWQACAADLDIREYYDKRCVWGLDLASTTDMCALAMYFPDDGALFNWHWIPSEGLEDRERRDHVPFGTWIDQGFVETAEGRAVEPEFMATRLVELLDDFPKLEYMVFDRWGSKELLRLLRDKGFNREVHPHGQGFRDMNQSVPTFERAVLAERIKHNSNPVMTYGLSGCVIQTDPAHGRKPNKDRSTSRIDGVVASIMAVGFPTWGFEKPKPSVYESRGLRVLGAKAT